jgi:hypothetical protein
LSPHCLLPRSSPEFVLGVVLIFYRFEDQFVPKFLFIAAEKKKERKKEKKRRKEKKEESKF